MLYCLPALALHVGNVELCRQHSISMPLAAGMACGIDKPSDVILFWFGQEWVDGGMDAKEYADRGIKRWFFGGPALDAECQKFIPLIRAAGAGNLRGEAWDDVPGLIARLVLLDQLSRNAFRGTPEAFAYDIAAQEVAVHYLGPEKEVPRLRLTSADLAPFSTRSTPALHLRDLLSLPRSPSDLRRSPPVCAGAAAASLLGARRALPGLHHLRRHGGAAG